MAFHGLLAHFFAGGHGLNNIPLSEYTIVLSVHIQKENLFAYIWAIAEKAAIKSVWGFL
jgi:hypothetical protein